MHSYLEAWPYKANSCNCNSCPYFIVYMLFIFIENKAGYFVWINTPEIHKKEGKISLHALSLNAGAGVPSDASESTRNLI